jgi:hypothetical protein
MTRLTAILLLSLSYISTIGCPSDTTKKNRQNYGEAIKLRIGGNYNFGSNYLKLEVGLYKNDFPYSINTDAWIIYHHASFFTTEVNINDKLFFGPKLGYEFSVMFVEARINFIDYFDFRGNNSFVFRPEIGATTFFGVFSICYGYNLPLSNAKVKMTQPHVISLIYNFQ